MMSSLILMPGPGATPDTRPVNVHSQHVCFAECRVTHLSPPEAADTGAASSLLQLLIWHLSPAPVSHASS